MLIPFFVLFCQKGADRRVVSGFGHFERMSDERIMKNVYKPRVDGVRKVG